MVVHQFNNEIGFRGALKKAFCKTMDTKIPQIIDIDFSVISNKFCHFMLNTSKKCSNFIIPLENAGK